MKKNKSVIFSLWFLALSAISIVIYFVFIKIETVQTKSKAVLYYDEEGIPPQDSALFEMGGWNNIPNLDQLIILASTQSGGQINKIVTYQDKSPGAIYVLTEIVGDEGTFYIYFVKNGDKWVAKEKKNVEKPIQDALYQKLQTPLSPQADAVSPE